jgi:uncharacterized protein YutE (UPF0331/DUF86 family)
MILGEHKILPPTIAKSLARLIKFRNILVHEYARLDLEKTWQAISTGVDLIEQFCRTMALWIDQS